MRRHLRFALFLSLAACGGPTGAEPGGSTGTAGTESSGTGGGERAGETDGFDMEGFEDVAPTVVHGTASARELIGVSPPPRPWTEMSEEEREYYMVAAVLPIAAEDFRAHDAERYANITCATCHGDDGRERGFALPSRYLPRLPAPGSSEWAAMTERPAYAFMAEVVTPTVRTQLGMPAYDPATGTGFGCFSCHPGGATR